MADVYGWTGNLKCWEPLGQKTADAGKLDFTGWQSSTAQMIKVPEHIIKAVVGMMEIEAKHHYKIQAMEEASRCELNGLQIDLSGVALDLLGVPPDNTVEQTEKFGHQGMIDHDDTVCRDKFTGRWSEIIDEGDPKEMAAFPRWVMAQLDSSNN